MANRYYTLLIVPEKTSQVRKILIPAWVAKSAALGLALVTLVGLVMAVDYGYVMSQISENKQLKMENRRLRQQVQVFKNKVTTIESTMDRIKTFATRLKVITNIEDRGNLLQSLNNGNLPDAATNIGTQTASSSEATPAPQLTAARSEQTGGDADQKLSAHASLVSTSAASQQAPAASPSLAPVISQLSASQMEDPEDALLRKESDQLDQKFSLLNRDSLYVEQMLQDEYELLADQKSFLAALPTVKPVIGYFTNGFGVRRSPFGGRVKMHEGLDIANRMGTVIRAPADGLVVFASTKAGYGQTLVVDHGYGIETWYGHTSRFLVNKGQKVHRGDPIARVGSSGRSTGPHLHYEVRVHGLPVDPFSYLLEN